MRSRAYQAVPDLFAGRSLLLLLLLLLLQQLLLL
jgi:hypothetical protein